MTLSSATLILYVQFGNSLVSLVSVWFAAGTNQGNGKCPRFLRLKFEPNWRTTCSPLESCDYTGFCRITDTPVFSGPAERRLSLASTTSAVLSVSLSQQRSQPEAHWEAAAAALSKVQASWARGEFPAIMSETSWDERQKRRNQERAHALNGELRRNPPLPIHLAIESGDHTPIKKTHLGHSSRVYAFRLLRKDSTEKLCSDSLFFSKYTRINFLLYLLLAFYRFFPV